MIVEQFVYRCLPGKLPAIVKRFETATVPLFERHGFRPIGFFTTVVGPSHQELIYLLQWESFEERDRCWKQFGADPEWHAARAESEKDGPLLENRSNQILAPTSFSPLR